MQCPLMSYSYKGEYNQDQHEAADCLEERCSWWDGHGGFCAVLKIARHLEASAISLAELLDKIPK